MATAVETGSGDQYPPLRGGKLLFLTAAIATASFMEILDMTIVNVSVPAISGSLGVSTSEVLLWMHDMQVPEPSHYAQLLDYLVVEERHLRGLVLRSQMRRMQWRIRT